ncbi:Gfo/Idh/MocA family protein [Natronobiforma cellulositropha]|uniref:Gfo/Idh/MocA family protein n=1 Tax=Natronobiforma cellulositropha TaxID=1679076 RepID=UPI0021D611B3|nr:Gfo/Idh/MocA family oxidoreductase [Natronobiforma cellulositropha]
MSDEPLSVGMLGYRFMGKAHSNALQRLPMFFPEAPDVELDVLIGRDEEAVAEAAARFGFSRTSTDWEDVVDEVDVFYNLGPNNVHADPSIAALENGASVFCEKPLAHTLEDAERMRDAARDAEGTAGIAFNYRFIPAVQYARSLIESGELGEIHHVRGVYLQDWLADPSAPWSWRNSKEVAGSGALGDLGAHTLDLSRFLVGEQVGDFTRLSGHLQTFVDERPVPGGDGGTLSGSGEESTETREVTVDDAYTAQAEFESGAIATFEASRFATGRKNGHSIEINGSEGSLRFSIERLNELEYLGPDDRGFQTILVTDEDDPYVDRWWPAGHIIGWEHTFVHENYEFLRAVAAGEEHTPSFEEGYRVQELLEAIERADESGEWVDVP